ncbi:hypothetical protein GE061_017085 [Apolygus lucorum]|uniref:Thioredoxin domain-containing protein 17 n=1 Tax=Apolygus lucorum TaxID=248454 RepID=A0A8S9XI26_APOLU|nr:hypothetical protein GE061_017085 [Apolygus lucorum]
MNITSPKNVVDEDWSPQFAEPIANVTVALGREAVLSCTVRNLGQLKVGWLKAEDQTVLSLDSKVVTHNMRVSVSHEPESDTWRLHIRQVKPSDKGCYMCQINTINMKKQIGCLDVHVPPDILDAGTSSDTEVQEGDNVTLVCSAVGQPVPRIQWRREDGRTFTVYNATQGFATVDTYSGEKLELVKVDYTQMGAYLCIASNDIPPAVSKRIVLKIAFIDVDHHYPPINMAEAMPESNDMIERMKEGDYAKVIEMADDLMGKGETVVLYFRGCVDEKTKKNWCTDCVKVEPVVEDFFKTTKFNKKIHLIEIHLCKDSMKDKNSPWKSNKDIMLKNVPTMILWKGSKDVRDKQMMKKDMLKMMFEDFIEK